MAAAKRDRRRADLAKFIQTIRSMGVPDGSAAEQAVWVILARHGSREGAAAACRALWKRFVGVNEFRVAHVTEIAGVIERHVLNDPIVAAEQARGFLRRFFQEFQMVDTAATEGRSPFELKKYLKSVPDYGREIALLLALHYCRKEVEDQRALEAPTDGKIRKRPEKEITASARRLRLLFAYAAYGSVNAKTQQSNASRAFVRAWAYKALPEPAAERPVRKGRPKKKAAAKKRAAGTARPARKRAATKKSSRR